MREYSCKCGVSVAPLVYVVVVVLMVVACQAETVGFDSDRWVKPNVRELDYLDRQALAGTAYLGDVEFENGIVEVDIAVTGARSYPGIRFRMQDAGNYEECYVRPHRAGLYPDAVQYTPVFNGISSWQLYSGEGYTSGTEIAPNEWIHMRIEVLGDQARVYLGDGSEPVLVVDRLEHGLSKGGIGISGPMDGSAYFSNFAYEIKDDLEFVPPVPVETAPGAILDWEISRPLGISEIDLEVYPLRQDLGELEWKQVSGGPTGLVDIGRTAGRTSREPDCVLARTVITADEAGARELRFGYSDWVGIYLNGEMLFYGSSAYQGRDPSFLGIIGLNDAVYLPLRKGENELLLMVVEAFGGWGFMCRDASVVFEYETVSEAWQTGRDFRVPESIAYDPAAGVLFVSNYDMFNPSRGTGQQFISKMSLDGTILDLSWSTGLENPTGMALAGDRLFVVERRGLAEIDTGTGEIVARHSAERPGFLNDAAADLSGNIYVSDSRANIIYRLGEGGLEVWLEGGAISAPNGLHVSGDRLLVGNNGDRSLKAVGLATGDVTTVARMGPGTIDGIASDREGNYIVSHWEGRVYRISPDGTMLKLLDLTGPQRNCADLGYVPDIGLLVIPGFADNRVRAYRVE